MNLEGLPSLLQRIPGRLRPIVLVIILGLAAGLAALVFQLAIQFLYTRGIATLGRKPPMIFLAGGLLVTAGTSAASGWLLTRFCPEAAGSGVPQLKLAFWRDLGDVPWRVVWVKFLGGILSVGGGSSLGREGPSVQLAGGLASQTAGLLGTARGQRRAAVAAGAAAGLAAAFNTPIAAVTFVLEEIIGDLNSRMLGGVLLAAILGALTAHGVLGEQPAFTLHGQGTPHWLAFALTPVVAAGAAATGAAFQRLTLGVRAWNQRRRGLPAWTRVMAGGIAVWAIGSAVFLTTGHLGVFSLGYDDLSLALDGQLPWTMAALLLAAKFAATTLCYGLGGCGGIFAPALFCGGMTGAALAGLATHVLSLSNADHVTLAVVGMCACLGAVVRAPVTGLLIVFEMTHEFTLVPVLMLGGLVSGLLARHLARESFYDAVLAQDGVETTRLVPPRSLRTWMELPAAHIANFTPHCVPELSPKTLRGILAQHPHDRFPLLHNGRLAGVITRKDAEQALATGMPPEPRPAVTCRPGDPIREVARRIVDAPGGIVVVIDASGGLVALITLHDLLRAQMTFADSQQA